MNQYDAIGLDQFPSLSLCQLPPAPCRPLLPALPSAARERRSRSRRDRAASARAAIGGQYPGATAAATLARTKTSRPTTITPRLGMRSNSTANAVTGGRPRHAHLQLGRDRLEYTGDDELVRGRGPKRREEYEKPVVLYRGLHCPALRAATSWGSSTAASGS